MRTFLVFTLCIVASLAGVATGRALGPSEPVFTLAEARDAVRAWRSAHCVGAEHDAAHARLCDAPLATVARELLAACEALEDAGASADCLAESLPAD